jgi:hypothetical protein
MPLNISYTIITFNFLDLNDLIDTPRGSCFMLSLPIIKIAPGAPELVNL